MPAPAERPIVVLTERTLLHFADRLAERLPGVELRWCVGRPDAELAAALADAEVFVGPRFTKELAAAAPRLRLIQVPGAGYDGIETVPPGVVLANTFHHEDAMAEYALWAAVGLRRGLVEADRRLREGHWLAPVQDAAVPLPASLRGARVGFYGFGHVGERAWRAFAHFGAEGFAVTGRGQVDADAHGLRWAGDTSALSRLCAEAEILVVSPPLNEQTRGSIAGPELDALGPGGVLINLARGPVVDEQALFDALRSGRLGAAAIDVWYRYPDPPGTPTSPADADFAALPNVLMTPHVSGVAHATFADRVEDIAANVDALRHGRPLRHLVEL